MSSKFSAPDILQFDIIELNIYILRSLLLLGIKGGFDLQVIVSNGKRLGYKLTRS